jgi:hypothetical protein
MSRHALCTTFIDLAEWTRRALRSGYRAGIFIGEESLTDFALTRVANRNPKHVRTRKFTRAQEGRRTGADWLWLFGSKQESWMPLLVQAKVMHPSSRPRAMLDYRNGVQNRLLLEFALEYRLFPVYCIYNPVTEMARKAITPGSFGLGIEQWACALLSPAERQRLLQSYPALRQPHVLAHALPLATLMCCNFGWDTLADRVAGILQVQAKSREEPVRSESGLVDAVLQADPREMIIPGGSVEEFISQIEEASTHSTMDRPLLAGVVQFSSTSFG